MKKRIFNVILLSVMISMITSLLSFLETGCLQKIVTPVVTIN